MWRNINFSDASKNTQTITHSRIHRQISRRVIMVKCTASSCRVLIERKMRCNERPLRNLIYITNVLRLIHDNIVWQQTVLGRCDGFSMSCSVRSSVNIIARCTDCGRSARHLAAISWNNNFDMLNAHICSLVYDISIGTFSTSKTWLHRAHQSTVFVYIRV